MKTHFLQVLKHFKLKPLNPFGLGWMDFYTCDKLKISQSYKVRKSFMSWTYTSFVKFTYGIYAYRAHISVSQKVYTRDSLKYFPITKGI